MNDDGNFRNVRNVRNVDNFRNFRTDIKCNTFLEPQAGAELNDDSYFQNGGNVGNSGMLKISGMLRISEMSG